MHSNFVNCPKTLTMRKLISVIKYYKIKSIRLVILHGIPQVCFAHLLVMYMHLISHKKLTVQLTSFCIVFWDSFNPVALRKVKIVYNFVFSECNRVNLSVILGPPFELRISEKLAH